MSRDQPNFLQHNLYWHTNYVYQVSSQAEIGNIEFLGRVVHPQPNSVNFSDTPHYPVLTREGIDGGAPREIPRWVSGGDKCSRHTINLKLGIRN